MTLHTVVRRTQLPAILGISLATIDRLRVNGDFPAPRIIGAAAVGFLRSEIDAWLDARPIKIHFTETV